MLPSLLSPLLLVLFERRVVHLCARMHMCVCMYMFGLCCSSRSFKCALSERERETSGGLMLQSYSSSSSLSSSSSSSH